MNTGGFSTDKHWQLWLWAVSKTAVRDWPSLPESWIWQGTANNANIFLLEGIRGRGYSTWEPKENWGCYSCVCWGGGPKFSLGLWAQFRQLSKEQKPLWRWLVAHRLTNVNRDGFFLMFSQNWNVLGMIVSIKEYQIYQIDTERKAKSCWFHSLSHWWEDLAVSPMPIFSFWGYIKLPANFNKITGFCIILRMIAEVALLGCGLELQSIICPPSMYVSVDAEKELNSMALFLLCIWMVSMNVS